MLLTHPNSNFNKISDKLKEELESKKLEVGQVVTFKLLSGKLNPDPEERRKPRKEILWRQAEVIVGKDRIKDPYSGDIVDIGVVKEFNKEGYPVCAKMYVPAADTFGYIFIVGGNVEQEQFYEFLLICNENESNPHRNKNVVAKFKQIDESKEAKKFNDDFDLLTEMLNYVKNSSAADRREMALAFGWDPNMGDEITMRKLREIVKTNPGSFKKTIGNTKELAVRALANEAIAAGVVNYSPMENKYIFAKTEEVIVTFSRSEAAHSVDQFVEWLMTNTKGNTVQTNIKRQLKAAPVED